MSRKHGIDADSDDRFRTLIENVSDIVVELDETSRIRWLSPSIETALGRSPDEFVGKSVRPLVHPDDRAALSAVLDRAYLQGESVAFAYRLLHVDGSWRWIEGIGRCFQSPKGRTHFVGVGRDLTEDRQLGEQLARQHKVDRAIAEMSSRFLELGALEIDGGIQVALDQIVGWAGADRAYLIGIERGLPHFVHTTGWSDRQARAARKIGDRVTRERDRTTARQSLERGEVVHIPDIAAVGPSELRGAEDLVAQGVQSVLIVPLRRRERLVGCLGLETVDRAKTWTEREITSMELAAGVLASVLRRKTAEVALADQVRMERRVSELSNEFLASTGNLQEAVLGVLAGTAEVARADHAYMHPLMSEADPDRITQGGFYPIGWQAPGLDLARPELPAWCSDELRAGRIVIFADDTELPAAGESARAEVAVRGVRSMIGIPLFSKHGPAGVLGFECHRRAERWSSEEISLLSLVGELFSTSLQRLQAEEALEDSRAQLFHAQKMDAVGRLAGGVAHDFNNLLMIILGYSRALHDELEPGSDAHGDVREITLAAERASDLTRQLLAFSRREPSHAERVDLNDLVSGVREMLGRLLRANVQLVFQLAPNALPVLADPRQLEQVLINLSVNARDAMPDGGSITIRTRERTLSAEECQRHGLGRPGRYQALEVVDRGEGMAEEVRARIFEPFYTTKDVGQGTGLGLSIAYSVAREHGGGIVVDSELHRGTTVAMVLPRFEGAAPLAASPARAEPALGSETILLVEDEPSIRRLIVRNLEAAGYHVLHASSGARALALADAFEGEIDLLVTDVVMAGMSGREVAHALQEKRSGLPVVFVSGHPFDPSAQHAEAEESVRFLQKPFHSSQLLARVREAIEGS
jgi:PAS domain S-box-containing protein